MKRQDILEIIVSNPQAIFTNGNMVAGKYSEYPRWYQVIGMAHDKSYVRVKGVYFNRENYLKTEDGSKYLEDEKGEWVYDTRPIAERCIVTYGSVESMPTRLVLKSEKTEASMLADFIEAQERNQREADRQTEEHEQFVATRRELANIMWTLELLDKTERLTDQWRHRDIHLDFNQAQMERLISVLKSAMTQMVGA